MDHIWEAPSRLKKTLALIFLKILAIILRQDFLKTLYIHKFNIIIHYLFILTFPSLLKGGFRRNVDGGDCGTVHYRAGV